jgi:hypothetical protein
MQNHGWVSWYILLACDKNTSVGKCLRHWDVHTQPKTDEVSADVMVDVNQFQISCCVWVVSEHVFSLPSLLLLNFGFCFSRCGQWEEETTLWKSVMSIPGWWLNGIAPVWDPGTS